MPMPIPTDTTIRTLAQVCAGLHGLQAKLEVLRALDQAVLLPEAVLVEMLGQIRQEVTTLAAQLGTLSPLMEGRT